MKLSYRPRASRDLQEITEYIAQDNVPAALRLRDRIEQSVLILKHNPLIGRETEIPGLYKWQIPGIVYAAYYRVEKDRIRIARVLHGMRQWPDSFFK